LPFAIHTPRLTRGHIEITAVASFAYAALFTTEGIGLWFQKRWAEYLTIVATSSLIPFEVWELVKKLTILRAALVIANVAIVIYLVAKIAFAATRADESAASDSSPESPTQSPAR